MEYRLINEEDRPAVEALWDYCFEKREEPFFQWYFQHYFQPARVVAGYARGELACCLHLNPYDLYLRGAVVPAAYIVGLATWPQARGGGAIRGLLAASLAQMRRQGRPVSILMPSRAEFYYPHQWLPCYHHLRYQVPLTDLRALAAAPRGQWTAVPGDGDSQPLAQVYEQFVARRHGYVVRSRADWRHLLTSWAAEGGYAYLLQDGGAPLGYILYALRHDTVVVPEMAYVHQAAQRAMFHFLYQHRSQAALLDWQAPLDDLTYCALPDPRQGVTVTPFMTGRLADVAAALAACAYDPAVRGQVALTVRDELAPWNDRTFVLTVRDGRGEVETLPGRDSGAHCGAGALAQLVFGRLGVADLVYGGGLRGADAAALDLLARLFPPCRNYINEYF